MSDTDLIGPWVRQFLVEHIVGERNLSRNTQASYRDTLVQLLPFVADRAFVSIECLTSKHLTADAVRLFYLMLKGRVNVLSLLATNVLRLCMPCPVLLVARVRNTFLGVVISAPYHSKGLPSQS